MTAGNDNRREGGLTGGAAGLFVRRPVLAIVLSILVVVAGVAAFGGVEVRELPNVDQPVITIRTNYTGATPETVDKEVTRIVEGAVARTPGVTAISSVSQAGQSRVTVEFDQSVDLNAAASDLRSAIGNIQNKLPDDPNLQQPTVVKADANSDAIMRLAITSTTMSIDELSDLVDNTISDRLSAVEGVADVQIYGDRLPIVRIMIDPAKMAARNLAISDLEAAAKSVALDAPAGSIDDGLTSLLVRADASATKPDQIENIHIDQRTRVGDIADVVYGPSELKSGLRFNGKTGVGVGIIRQAKSNTLAVSQGVRAAVAELNQTLPKGVSIVVTSDDATFISGAIREVLITLALATVIVIAVIYVFLRSIRITFIPAVTVPVALIGTIAAIWLAGFSVNILTLLALVLSTGLVVDDAIVVIENIARRRAVDRLGPRAAAVLGTRQVFFAVLATTATLVSVFVPISFFPGTAGRLFSEFGFVLAFSVILSCFVALTLSPMLASRWIGSYEEAGHHHELRNPVGRAVAALGGASMRLYRRLLEAALDAPLVLVTAALLFAAGSVVAYRLLPEELTPQEDRGVVPISVSTPQGVLDRIHRRRDAQDRSDRPALSEKRRGDGSLLDRRRLRRRHQQRRLHDPDTGTVGPAGPRPGRDRPRDQRQAAGPAGGAGIAALIQQPRYPRRRPRAAIRRYRDRRLRPACGNRAEKPIPGMQQLPDFGLVRLAYDTTQPQVSIRIDRARAADLGIPVATIATAVTTLLNGDKIGTYYAGDRSIDVFVQAPAGFIQNPHDLDYFQVKTAGGKMVPLASVVSFEEGAVAPQLGREDQKQAVPIRRRSTRASTFAGR